SWAGAGGRVARVGGGAMVVVGWAGGWVRCRAPAPRRPCFACFRRAGVPTRHAMRGVVHANRGLPALRDLGARVSRPAMQCVVWFTRTGDSLLCKGTWRLDKPLFFNGFRPSENSPPATEVWFRCAPPHVASLINGNGVVDRKLLLLMSGGAAVASSCVAGPL